LQTKIVFLKLNLRRKQKKGFALAKPFFFFYFFTFFKFLFYAFRVARGFLLTSRGLASVGDLVSQMYKFKTELASTKPTLKFA
jgi:hypothetical protein